MSFAGTGSDPDGTISAYAWTFPGGTPASSTAANAGNVTYSTPGTYTASFRVTDNRGLHERSRDADDHGLGFLAVGDTGVANGPARRRHHVTPPPWRPLNGFTGTVAFSVTGLPSGATATFTPPSVTTSGSTTMSVSTSAATPPGSYPLTIRGTSGPRTRTVNVTLVVERRLLDLGDAGKPDDRQGRRRHLHRDDYGGTGILRHGESLGERCAAARDGDVQPRVDREFGDLRADDRYRTERAEANAHADDHGHRRWTGPLGQRDADHSVGAMAISRRTLLRRLGAFGRSRRRGA